MTFTVIATGSILPSTTRFSLFSASFANTTSYLNYRVTFPTIRAASANSMQVAEVQLLTAPDISSPADVMTITFPDGGSSPAGETVINLVDNRLDRKLDIINAGAGPAIVDITPAVGATLISGITFYGAADDAAFPGRTPQSFTLYGSNNGVDFAQITSSTLVENTLNFTDQSFSFDNAQSFTRYRIEFATPFGGGDMQLGEIELHGVAGAPINDSCANPIPVGPGTTAGSNVNATSDASSGCDIDEALDVWYSYSPQFSGEIAISTCGSQLDTTVAIFSACGQPVVTCNDNSCRTGSIVEFFASAGQTYLVRVAGVRGATGSFSLYVDNFPIPHDNAPLALPYNFNGMVHPSESGVADALDGYRSISDRGLRVTGEAGGIDVGLRGPSGIPYQIASLPNTLDIVHIGNRDTVDNFNHIFDEFEDGDDTGVRPTWLPDSAQEGPHTSDLRTGRFLRMGENTEIGVIYQVSNGGGDFDMTLGFYDGSSAVVRLSAPDWFGDQNPAAPALGVAAQRQLGTFTGSDSVDLANDGVDLNVVEAIVSTASLRDGGIGEFSGKRLASISFGNRSNFTAGYAVIASTLRDPGCPADYDGSGGVDSDDTIAFFADWDAGLIGADYTGEGGVDADDVIEFFARWDSGC